MQNKYNAQRTEFAGRMFDSRAEALRAHQLRLLQQAGVISDLRMQVTFRLTAANIKYRADFVYTVQGRMIAEDVKGVETDRFRLICKLWAHYGPCVLCVVKRRGARFVQTREIFPPVCPAA